MFVSTIILVILFLLAHFIKRRIECFITNSEKSTDGVISVCILNYNRPHNLQQSVDQLVKYPEIKEIFIFHGHPDHYREINHDKVINIKDYDNNIKYGAGRRFLHHKQFNSRIILLLDDDLIPSHEWIKDGIKKVKQHQYLPTIYGSSKRRCNGLGYDTDQDGFILTNCCLVTKDSLQKFVEDKYFEKTKKWLHHYKGNCEDLIFNLYVINVLGNKPIFVEGDIRLLDGSNGYSHKPEHYTIRGNFCKKYHDYTFKTDMSIL
jgi:hypothetical protein